MPFCCGFPGSILATLIPNLIHQILSCENPDGDELPREDDAEGPGLAMEERHDRQPAKRNQSIITSCNVPGQSSGAGREGGFPLHL